MLQEQMKKSEAKTESGCGAGAALPGVELWTTRQTWPQGCLLVRNFEAGSPPGWERGPQPRPAGLCPGTPKLLFQAPDIRQLLPALCTQNTAQGAQYLAVLICTYAKCTDGNAHVETHSKGVCLTPYPRQMHL